MKSTTFLELTKGCHALSLNIQQRSCQQLYTIINESESKFKRKHFSPIVNDIIDTGVILRLLQFLHYDSIRLQLNAIKILNIIASINCNEIILSDGISDLITIINKTDIIDQCDTNINDHSQLAFQVLTKFSFFFFSIYL